MKILMFGRGVISTLYGWALEGAGHTVEFYVRPGRAIQYGPHVRLNICDLRRGGPDEQHVETNWPITMREDLPPDHDYDMIFVSLTHYRLKEAVSFLSSRSAHATIAIFNNFWDDPIAATADLPRDQIAWGFPGAGGGFQSSGELQGALFPSLEFGTFGAEPSERERAARKIFSDAGFAITEHRRFRDWLWVHFSVSAAITAQQLRAGTSRRDVYWNRDGSMEEAIRTVREIMPLISARGIDINNHPELTLFNKPEEYVLGVLAPSLKSAAFQAAIDGHTNPEELRVMFEDVLEEGRRLGVSLPRFEAAKNLEKQSAPA